MIGTAQDWSRFRRIAIDTAPIIYYIEKHDEFLSAVAPMFEAIADGDVHTTLSSLVLTELLVRPFQLGERRLAQTYRSTLTQSRGVTVQPITVDIAVSAADLRAEYGIRTPDALHVASAIETGCSAFVTNDHQLAKVDEIEVLLVADLV